MGDSEPTTPHKINNIYLCILIYMKLNDSEKRDIIKYLESGTEHLQNIFDEGELQEDLVSRDFRHTTQL